MRGRKNSTWGDTVSGEWWLTEDGDILYADQDIGERGHEAIAIEHMIDSDVFADGLLEEGIVDEQGARDIREEGPVEALFTLHIPDEVGLAATSKDEIWNMIVRGQAREAFMKHYGAVLVLGNAFTAWQVTAKTIGAIQNFVFDQFGEEADPKMELTIEQIYPMQKWTTVEWGEFQFVKKPSELRWSK